MGVIHDAWRAGLMVLVVQPVAIAAAAIAAG
jgi:hypothetical protein